MGSHDVEGAYEFYVKLKVRLAEASFNLRKFDTNSPELCQRINDNEWILCQGSSSEESPSETQSQLSDPDPGSAEHQVLGVNWHMISDELIFDIGDVCQLKKDTRPTKRNAVSLATRFFDPLGVISPMIVRFKLLFQQLCETKTGTSHSLEDYCQSGSC